ncbi:hypothetical protein ACHQM5_030688 [Ranunculus cassubicifolius]
MAVNNTHHHRHVAILAFPFGTHAAPLFSLIRRLAAAAPDVTFSFFGTSTSNASTFGPKTHPKQKEDNIKTYNVDDGVPEGYMFTGKRQEDIELFVAATPGNFKAKMDEVVSQTKLSITCLVTDAFLSFAEDMANEMNVQWVPLWTAGASAVLAHLYTDLLRNTITGGDAEVARIIPGLAPAIRIKDLPLEVLHENKEFVLGRLLDKMAQTLPRATVIAINSFQELDPDVISVLQSKFFQQCLTLGPFNLIASPSQEDPHGCISWLSKHKPTSVAYVSFGTVTTPPPSELAALAQALEESRVAFLWSLKDNQKIHLPDGFLDRTSDRGMVAPWVPQSKVLEHESTGVFVTHCGWNSVMESMTGGVPMICRPFFGDQNLNGRLVSAVWEIGVEAKNRVLSKEGVMKALELILHSEQGKQMRRNVVKLKQLAEQAVGREGSSTNNFSTLLKMVNKE